jgi:hypothetical protein
MEGSVTGQERTKLGRPSRYTNDQVKAVFMRLRATGTLVSGQRLRSELGGGNAQRYRNLIAQWTAEENGDQTVPAPGDDETRVHNQVYREIFWEIRNRLRKELPYLKDEVVDATATALAIGVHDNLIQSGLAPDFRDPSAPAGNGTDRNRNNDPLGGW